MAIYALGASAPDIAPSAFVHPDATVIGDVTIGEESTIWPQAVLRGDYGKIVIGDRTNIQDGAVIHCTRELDTFIGDDCVIGHLAHLECCVVENGALVGTGSIVLHKAVVRSGALVGAAALVPNGMNVPAGSIAVGVPARLRDDAADSGALTADIARNTAEYVENGERYVEELRRLD
ncbi:MAG TPA: gamma carbonic anhydrase family protein [Acidimicrobiia bacterium]|jgi:carbonic anhydrase/acetyltransferase-like protein (isoleucine patch superfamily)